MRHHGQVSEFYSDDAGGTERELTDYVEEFAISMTKGVADATTKGDAARVMVGGKYGFELTLTGVYDDTATSGPSVVLMGLVKASAAADFRLGMGGLSAGDRSLAGQAIWSDYQETSPLEGAVKWTAKASGTGIVTEAVVA